MAGEFYDQAHIMVQAGNGGDGSATFRREKYVPRGGPDGGDGGHGGNIYLVADAHLNTLLKFREQRRFIASPGKNGGTSRKHGRDGQDIEIRVPPGTVARTEIDGVLYEVDLSVPGSRLLAASGGRGGLGNVHFATSTYQVPRIAELGEPGQKFEIDLELKLLADVGLVGFPNAGKSTLISVISATRPKIANYPFTTLQPNLGVVGIDDYSFVVADLPGLISGAHRGVGLGFDFLRHIERTRVLLHIVDAAGSEGRDPVEDYRQICEELVLYQPELAQRTRFVALNKTDLPEAADHYGRLLSAIEIDRDRIFEISAATGDGVDALVAGLAGHLSSLPVATSTPQELSWPVPLIDERIFTIEPERAGWRVRGRKIERLISMTNFAQADSLMRIQRVFEATGISAALINAGIEEGNMVYVEKAELLWSDEYVP